MKLPVLQRLLPPQEPHRFLIFFSIFLPYGIQRDSQKRRTVDGEEKVDGK